tara:strand:- start:1698 stop:2060 length:363 start_codon:yes stop_codon:yes gene_type:complete
LNTSLTKVSIWADTGIETVDVVDSVLRVGVDVGEDRGTYVGVGLGIAAALAVAVASRIGGLVTGPNGAAIGVGADVGATKVDVSDGLLHAEMMAITVKIIGMTLVFRSTLCSLRVAPDAF